MCDCGDYSCGLTINCMCTKNFSNAMSSAILLIWLSVNAMAQGERAAAVINLPATSIVTFKPTSVSTTSINTPDASGYTQSALKRWRLFKSRWIE